MKCEGCELEFKQDSSFSDYCEQCRYNFFFEHVLED